MEEWKTLLGLKPEQFASYTAQMEEVINTLYLIFICFNFLTIFQIFLARKYITVFNPNENATEDMDKAILRSILRIHVLFYP